MSTGPIHRFTHTPDPDNSFDHISVVIETHSDQLDNVLCAMEAYLKAAGFCMDGRCLELIETEPTPQPDPWSDLPTPEPGPELGATSEPLPPLDASPPDDVPF